MTTETVNKQTGEMTPPETSGGLVLSAQMQVMSPTEAKKAVGYLQDIKKSILRPKIDFGKIPGAGQKDVLFKAGAQKLCAFFNLAAHYSVVHRQEEFFREWEYIVPIMVWDESSRSKVKTGETSHLAKGFYAYEVSCQLKHRSTSEVWATGSGNCNSTERGRESAPANTILKMAEKRAFLQATLDATFSSELFTQDVEDFSSREDKAATAKQIELIRNLQNDISLDISDKLQDSINNFVQKDELRTMENASLLIGKLKSCPKKSAKSEPKADEPKEKPLSDYKAEDFPE